jgi:hypothetical protein
MSAPTAADLAKAEEKLEKLRSEAATALEKAKATADGWKLIPALAATGALLIKAAEGQVASAEEYAKEVEKLRKKVEAASAAADSGGSGVAASSGSGSGGTKGGRRGKYRAKKTRRRKRSTKHR